MNLGPDTTQHRYIQYIYMHSLMRQCPELECVTLSTFSPNGEKVTGTYPLPQPQVALYVISSSFNVLTDGTPTSMRKHPHQSVCLHSTGNNQTRTSSHRSNSV